MEKLPVLRKISEVGIPTKRLNTIEQKNYRTYAETVCDYIKTMLNEIRSKVLSKYEQDNKDKIIDTLVVKFKVKSFSEEAKSIAEKAKVINIESKKLVASYENKIAKLEMERDAAVAKLKDEKMFPLIEEFQKHRDKLQITKNLKDWYYTGMRIKTNKEYQDKDDDDEDGREIDIQYPIININEVISVGIKERFYLLSDDIDDELDVIMKPAKEEFDIAELKLASMEQSVREVMLFDEAQMNEAFSKLLEFRDSIQRQHISVVKGIDPSVLNNGGKQK